MKLRIVFGSYMVRYPMGGMMSYVLQYLVGFQRLGCDIYFVEKAGYSNACFDPTRGLLTDDCGYGIRVVSSLLDRFGLGDRWCFVDAAGRYHGMFRGDIESVFRTADIFIDMGTHGSWLDEAEGTALRVLIDGEPGYNQIKMEQGSLDPAHRYDRYYTNGLNVGTTASESPAAGRSWGHIVHPVVSELFTAGPAPRTSPFTTVMNWQSHEQIRHEGISYGQKDLEFEKFVELPAFVDAPMEVAVSGSSVPIGRLEQAGWTVRDGHQVAISFDSFHRYLASSKGEFSVAKNIFVALNTGWFSDRSAAYLASGRPVVLQDTGYSSHVPVGEGLFAVDSPAAAAAAIKEITSNPTRHERAARELASEFFDASVVLTRFLEEVAGVDQSVARE